MRTALILATILVLPVSLGAQGTRIVDEGSFTISVNGRTAGRENFRITATTRGEITEYVARADVTFGDRKLTPELRAEAQGGVVDYTATTKAGGNNEAWRGEVARGRLTARISTGRGNSVREYIVPQGALLLDEEVIHQHWFLVLRSRNGEVPVVLPRRANVQASASMATVGEETIQVGNHDLAATHIRASIGGDAHDIWVDKSGRLLKVGIPSKGLMAVRDDPPSA